MKSTINNNEVVFPVAVDVDKLPPVEHEIDVVPLITGAVGVDDAIKDIILAVTSDPEGTDDSEYQSVAESPSELQSDDDFSLDETLRPGSYGRQESLSRRDVHSFSPLLVSRVNQA